MSLTHPPSGWYCVAFSEDLRPGDVLGRTLAGRGVVVFRGPDGVTALDRFCPHLGADFAEGGTIVDGTLRCPFHGFRFGSDGRCVATEYGGKVPPTAVVDTWPAREVNGLVMVWFGSAGEAPWFEIPEVDRAGWTTWRHHTFDFRGHPQEVAENAVDTGHLVVVHGYRDVRALAPLETDGPLLRAKYTFERPRPAMGQSTVRAEIDIHQWGLGYALVEVTLPALGLRTRQLVLTQPTDEGRVSLRIGMAVREIEDPGRLHWLLSAFPARRWLTERVADASIAEYRGDVAQDLRFWETKAHVQRPALADGDGPIGRYRTWVRQFYRSEGAAELVPRHAEARAR